MAIQVNDDGSLDAKTTKVKTIKPKSTTNDNFIKFGNSNSLDLLSMKTGRGRENINKMVKIINELKNNHPNLKDINMHVFDNTIHTNLEYSNITFSLLKDNNIFYYIVLFSNTGRKHKTAIEIYNIVFNNQNNYNQNRFNEIWTIDEAINDNLHKFIINNLKSSYNGDYDAYTLEGVIIDSEENIDLDILSERILYLATSVLVTEAKLYTKDIKDLNITHAMNNTNNKVLSIDTNFMNENLTSIFGDKYRSDWMATLYYKPNSNNYSIQQLNSAVDANEELCSICGFVDVIPTIYRDHVSRVELVRFRPHIIITKVNLDYPTLNYLMLGLLTSLVMASTESFIASLFYGPSYDAGILNIMAKLDQNEGKPIKLKDGKKQVNDSLAILSEMVCLDPVISIDVPHFNDSSSYLSILLSISNNSTASSAFINSLYNLTNGQFSDNFSANEIFNNSGVIIPMGYWNSKNGVRDIRDIDIGFILSNFNDINLANMWALSSLPSGVNNVNPYLSKIDIISKIIPDAVISGKATRLTFTNNFINTLQIAAKNAGFTAIHKPNVNIINNNIDINRLSDYYNSFGINGVNIINNYMGGGINYNNNVTMGNRY